VPGGITVRLRPEMTSGPRMVYFNGRPEYHEMGFVEHYLRPGDRFLDIGANIGIFTLVAAKAVGAEGHVDALECVPRTLTWLEEHVALNGVADWVTIHRFAASDREGTLQFRADRDGTNHILAEGEQGSQVLEVPTHRLDDVFHMQRFALAKMDIEGAEPMALAGSTLMLDAANPPVWILELNGALHKYGWTEEQLAQWLSSRGYDLALYDADQRSLSFPDRPWERGGGTCWPSRGGTGRRWRTGCGARGRAPRGGGSTGPGRSSPRHWVARSRRVPTRCRWGP
ncbi:MAG TPA: FkbM family methyltransferase, partial [bacterium]|nr:FkbM family methyltransferase [bacterium]